MAASDRTIDHRARFTGGSLRQNWDTMDAEKTIAEIEWLEHLFTLPDNRPLPTPDEQAANHCPIFGHVSPDDPLCIRCGLPLDPFDAPRGEAPRQMAQYYWGLCAMAALMVLLLCLLIR